MEQFAYIPAFAHRMALGYLAAALAPRITVERAPDQGTTEAMVRLSAPRLPPRMVRIRPWLNTELARLRLKPHSDIVWLLASGSTELRDELRVAGQSYIDPGGAVRLDLPGLLIDRTDLDPADFITRTEVATDPFADRSSLVVRALLSASVRRTWGVRELAQVARVSLGTASRTVEQLTEMDLVASPRLQGRLANVRVVNPQRMLDSWTRAYEWTRNESLAVHAPIGDADSFITRRLPHLLFRDRKWALTLQAGASRLARLASWERIHVYIECRTPKDLSAQAFANNWTPGTDGRIVLMRPFYRTSVWDSLQQFNRASVVSALQLVVDLWHYPLRGREQAELIRDTVLKPVWDS
jgi:hypothetical protein